MKFFSAASNGARRLHPLPSIFVALAVGMAVAAATRASPADGDGEGNRPVGERVAGAALPPLPYRVADDAAPPAAPADAAPANAAPAAPASAAPAVSDRVSQENIFWTSVQKSNTLADYKAYLEAYPNGAFAPLARNRIAAMAPLAETPLSNAPAAGPPPLAAPGPGQRPSAQSGPAESGPPQASGAPQAEGPQNDENMPGPSQNGPGPGQNAPSAETLSAEVGTAETEQALNLNRRDARVLQERLAAQGLYSGPIDGDLGPGSRAAIAQWQQRQGTAPTGFLGPLLLETLQSESGPVNGERISGQACPPGFHAGRYGRRCWADR
jgi:hypothetical protein